MCGRFPCGYKRCVTMASTVDEVIEQLGSIVEAGRREAGRWGFFASLYKRMTVAMRAGIGGGRFSDPSRVAEVDVAFANRYLAEFESWRRAEETSRTWAVAFAATGSRRHLVLQHLLSGMNAHINLDLGISVAEVVPAPDLAGFEPDYLEINRVIAEQVDLVQGRVGELSPWLAVVDLLGGRTDEAVFNFSVVAARRWAWTVAQRLSGTPRPGWGTVIDDADRRIERLAGRIVSPGPVISLGVRVARLAEEADVSAVLDVLER